MVGLTMEIIVLIWLGTVFICTVIDVSFFVKKDITNYPVGLFLIFCPILNVIYSAYITIKYFDITDLKKFL